MQYSLTGADVVHPTTVGASKTAPIELEGVDAGPDHEAIARLGRGEGQPLVIAGHYRLIRRLGGGGMGAVYLAEDLDRYEREVAVKILDASSHDWCRTIERFLWEARLAARVRHPNVVEAFDFGSTPEGVVYMVMERLEGRDLRAIVRHHALSWRWTLYMMRQICAGVDALHRLGVIHRDLKSSNCFYCNREGVVKVLDFGIATFENAPMAALDPGDRTIIGTPEYMAPELIRGELGDRRADVYAGGILVHELLTGRTPFDGRTAEEIFERQLDDEPPLAELEDLAPRGVREVVRKALAKQASRRFASMAELAAALEEYADERGPTTAEILELGGGDEAPSFDEAPTLRWPG